MESSDLGPHGEKLAEKFLRRAGFRILERNFRRKGGEIDLVCVKNGVIVFVEVKTRKSLASGHPLESLTPFKKERLLRTGYQYLAEKQIFEKAFRFDLVAILLDTGGRVREIQHIENFLED
ncbi:MAG: YraN family protein [Caldiserica bacterium]|jgi:putative endonuclease|nr:YraN family protein [Caldisericota bacterium]MDH7562892.1 YraN family protein [Caldisericota bacterium]